MKNSQSLKNKEIIRGLYENALNKKNMELLKTYIAGDFTGITGKKDYEAFAEPFLGLIKAAPDLEYKIEELISEGDKVAVKWKLHGTQTGPIPIRASNGKNICKYGNGNFHIAKR